MRKKYKSPSEASIAFIGSAGIPNRYGGFEAFLENCSPEIAKHAKEVYVSCDDSMYEDKSPLFHGVKRVFIPIKANGTSSIIHDALAFIMLFNKCSHFFFLGISGAIWLPFFRLLCLVFNKKIIINIDGIEWRRDKFSTSKKTILKIFDFLAQFSSHKIIYDNQGLEKYINRSFLSKSYFIPYSGDHVIRNKCIKKTKNTALTICRIEPENNLELIIEGIVNSSIEKYSIVGNWEHSDYSKNLREKYKNIEKIKFINPVYDPIKISEFRESCEVYLHGHSVGGTNPSLVEMIFYDCRILCFDVNFNRYTTDNKMEYFKDSNELSKLLENNSPPIVNRTTLREKYSKYNISQKYLNLID